MPDENGYPSSPWDWNGGYPQRVVASDGTLVAEVWEDPDAPAVIAPLICEAANARLSYPEKRDA